MQHENISIYDSSVPPIPENRALGSDKIGPWRRDDRKATHNAVMAPLREWRQIVYPQRLRIIHRFYEQNS